MSKIPKKKIKRIIIGLIIIVGLFLFFWYENKHLVVTTYSYESVKIDKALEGYRIVQISDLHNASFGRNNSRLLDAIDEQQPDIVVITGDIVDANHTSIETALSFAKDLADKYSIYYVTGNHEYWLSDEDRNELISGLEKNGVTVLENESVTISSGNAAFRLVGLDDNNLMDNTLKQLIEGHEDELSVVLAHEPQYLSYYAGAKADLVLSGHAHGGQFRLPFIGGVVAPNQGFNPEYTEGMHSDGSTSMIISRGLGNSIIPIRLFNDPEIVCIEFHKK